MDIIQSLHEGMKWQVADGGDLRIVQLSERHQTRLRTGAASLHHLFLDDAAGCLQ